MEDNFPNSSICLSFPHLLRYWSYCCCSKFVRNFLVLLLPCFVRMPLSYFLFVMSWPLWMLPLMELLRLSRPQTFPYESYPLTSFWRSPFFIPKYVMNPWGSRRLVKKLFLSPSNLHLLLSGNDEMQWDVRMRDKKQQMLLFLPFDFEKCQCLSSAESEWINLFNVHT